MSQVRQCSFSELNSAVYFVDYMGSGKNDSIYKLRTKALNYKSVASLCDPLMLLGFCLAKFSHMQKVGLLIVNLKMATSYCLDQISLSTP